MSGGESRDENSPRMEPNRGLVADGWFYEEDQGQTRLGIRIAEHLHSEQSAWQKIDVYRSDFHGHVLTLDDLVMLTTRDEFVYHEMLTHVPLCAIEVPKNVLIIGGGDCGACARCCGTRRRTGGAVRDRRAGDAVSREHYSIGWGRPIPIRGWSWSSTTA